MSKKVDRHLAKFDQKMFEQPKDRSAKHDAKIRAIEEQLNSECQLFYTTLERTVWTEQYYRRFTELSNQAWQAIARNQLRLAANLTNRLWYRGKNLIKEYQADINDFSLPE